MSGISEDRQGAGVFNRIIDCWASGKQTVSVAVPLDNDDVVTIEFRTLNDRKELKAVQKASEDFARTATPETCPVVVNKPFFDTDEETKRMAYCLAKAAVDPDLSVIEFLRLAKNCAKIFDMIAKQYEALCMGSVAKTEKDAIEAIKNASGATLSGETA